MLHRDIFIYETESIKNSLRKLDKTEEKVLLVADNEDRLLGTITDGDIRRYILSGQSLENDIREVYNRRPIYIKQGDFSVEGAKKMLTENKIDLVPILNEENKVIDFISWNKTFPDSAISMGKRAELHLPVVIMAGGKGTRLEPLSRVFPKPLLPIGDTPIIELIIGEFRKQGVTEYYLTLNHKSEMIKSYFNNTEKDYQIKYFWEKDFLGTAGSLKLLEKEITDLFIVSNCDVIIKANFEEVVNFHKQQNASLTILSSIQHYKIPYGVIKIKKEGEVLNLFEKPEYSFVINAGVYILSKKCLQFIPKNSCFDMTDLIKKLIENNKKVITYPVNESAYIDIGQRDEYKKALDYFHKLVTV